MKDKMIQDKARSQAKKGKKGPEVGRRTWLQWGWMFTGPGGSKD